MTAMADPALTRSALAGFRARRRAALFVPLAILAYLVYAAWSFDLAGVASRMRPGNAVTFLSDIWSHKTHVTRDNRSGQVTVAIEGERKGTYAPDAWPAWVQHDGAATRIDLGPGGQVTYDGDRTIIESAALGTLTASRGPDGISLDRDPATLPAAVDYDPARLDIRGEGFRLSVTRSRTELFRYFPGWELFWFTLDSPYSGHSLPALLFGPQIDPAHSNLAGMWRDFWGNQMWRHADVAWAMGETVLMAFLGTVGAAMAALPLAFLAARNFAPLVALRFATRRLFDFLRGVDGLIWTIVLSRAFGPGPLTGTLAILLTDTGTFGKTFSEALENVDDKQVEGIRSTGAAPIQRYRFGVIPQITPVLLSQLLYYFESNTRSATIIGAITGGGIGLLLTQAMQTQKDWEEVAYYVLLIIAMVFVMDSLSGWLRRRLIKG